MLVSHEIKMAAPLNTTSLMNLKDVVDEKVANAIQDGAYTLILGAGGSLGATSKDGKPLPLASEYAKELVGTLGLNIRPDTPLPYVWEAAQAKLGSDEALRKVSTRPRFLNCAPAQYHQLIPTFAWRRIYTFNVDDIIPAAYRVSNRLQDPLAIHFDQDYRDVDTVNDEIQVIYLHGAEIFPDLPVTFGPPAYAASATRQHTWWHVFADTFLSQPVIVVGASLREPDFETYLYLKRRPPGPLLPSSLFVAPNIDDADRATCERLGLVPIPLPGDQFLVELAKIVTERERLSVRRARQVKLPLLVSGTQSAPLLATIGRQFVILNDKSSWPITTREPAAFYEGSDCTWDDIRDQRDVQLAFEQRVFTLVRDFLRVENPTPRIQLSILEGTAGSAKTTALMRIAASLAELRSPTLYFCAKERLRDDVLTQLVSMLPPDSALILAIDSLADHTRQLARFVLNYPKGGPRCFILAAERSGQKSYIQRSFSDVLLLNFEPIPNLTKPEALDLASKLRSAAKLGRFAGHTDQELADRFIGTTPTDWGGQLIAILLDVVPGGKFLERLSSEWQSLGDDALKTFYGCVCLAAAGEAPIKSAIAFRAIAPYDAREVFEKFAGKMRGLVTWFDVEWLRPRHRVIAEATVRHCMSSSEVFDISLRLGAALAPYVSRNAIMNRTPEAKLARRLMDADGMVVSRLRRNAEEWFGLLERNWGWNSRYWEQRALVALREKRYQRARDYAEQAVGLEQHPLPMTTCALVMIVSAEKDPSLHDAQRESFLKEGVELLDDAIRRASARGWGEIHPYHVLLIHAVRVSRTILGELPNWLSEKIRSHAREASRLFSKDPEIRSALVQLEKGKVV